MKLGEHLAEVDQPCADEHLFAEFVGVGRPAAVFGVDATDMRTEDVDRIDRIGFAVKQQVGGVEADAKVGHGHVADGARHGGRGLLAGLHQESLAVALAVLRDGADGFDGLRVERIARIFRNKTAMGLHLRECPLAWRNPRPGAGRRCARRGS